ncbi:Large repetitive protein [Leucobacter sp. 7(1)]|uniref:Ig-like domain-containing protein n=1 Tax=Leucobacter sp. 7(1) TaxID=1255613 RepID=UPI00097F299F|nr:Ig-like domain-containing protein [Leucobacter sp. 7(1)]SJN10647.1 Large repetitive protein [Leucobacter sp. 7(1)]
MGIAALVAVTGMFAPQLGGAPVPAAHAADTDAPQIYKFQGFWDRIDGDVDEIRADLVLRVPQGYVNKGTGALQSVNGQQLRVGHEYSVGSGRKSHAYINTMQGGKAGAEAWAKNRDERFTIHKVIPSGKFDFLVMSIEGDIDITNAPSATNIPGGLLSNLNFYFSYASGAPGTTTGWISSALTTEPAPFYWYYGTRNDTSISGPQFRIPWDNTQELWSAGQANWGQVLDYGLSSSAPGSLPPNSIGLDLVNNATRSNPETGYAGTVSDSFWYAWVHEDGSLVESINTGPIRVTGVKPSGSWYTNANQIPKNVSQADWPGRAVLGWTQEQADQGLTGNVAPSGETNFEDAGGTGYYRLLAWPEARDPNNVVGDNGSPRISYSAADLFDGNGMVTPEADAVKWTTGSVYYKYELPIPDAPVITVPPENSHTNVNNTVTISGTGTPGHTITLKFTSGETITDFNDPALETLVDGQHEGVLPEDVVVDSEGNWSYTYTPATPLPDGPYTVVAAQTDPTPGFLALTSEMSNPNDPDPAVASDWGVTFFIDTVAPDAPAFVCPATPTEETAPTFTGSGIEAGAKVFISQDGERIGEATVTGTDWSYTVDPALTNGTYVFTVTQVDAAGNESAVSAPPCELRVAVAVPGTGAKVVVPVQYPDPSLPEAAVENWEITLTDGDDTVVMSGGTPAQLKRDTVYTVGERLRADPAPEATAARYTQLGELVCVDGEGEPLPNGVVDPDASTVTVGSELEVAEPLACTLNNQAAQVSFVTQRLGGQTTVPAAGWTLGVVGAEPGYSSALTDTAPSDVARPGEATVSAGIPAGLSLIGIQALDLTRADCAAHAPDATAAPQDCWITLEGAGDPAATLAQGTHSVFRLVAATPADLPALPITGGLGSWVFMVGGAAVFALAGGTYLRRRHLLTASLGTDPSGGSAAGPSDDGRGE